jgi:uncharacterized membrane protein
MRSRSDNPLRWLGIALVVTVVVAVTLGVLAALTGGGFGWMHDGGGMGWGFLFMIVPGVFLVLVLLAAVGALTPTTAPAPQASAVAVLDVRYARGEISREEYFRLRADLAGQPPQDHRGR